MHKAFDTRRYLTNFDSRRAANIVTDCLVIGSGVAGSRAAIEAASHCDVILMCKGGFRDSNTSYAQGGIAVAKTDESSIEAHIADTMKAGCGLNDRDAVRLLVTEGPARLREMLEWGIRFDHKAGELALGLEGGHSVHRIVHARGDETGRELVRTLELRVREARNLRIFENCFLIDFLVDGEACVGAVTFHEKHRHQLIWAKQVVLATGGCGQVWRETTNPPGATGDGLAAAFRAGVTLRDMEMVQFHPTTLYVAGAARALISEAVRGEGAHLVDRAGHRFMREHHPDGELAPRDVVSRTIHEHLVRTHAPCVFLDVRHIANFGGRFPNIARLCADFQIDVERDLIPVRPSAHYLVGGVIADVEGKTTLAGLWCCGESASTGVHGANRLASNSLLEGLVFGKICGERAGQLSAKQVGAAKVGSLQSELSESPRTPLDVRDVQNSLRSMMTRNLGIVRHADALRETNEILDFWGHYTLDKIFDEPASWEVQNELTLSRVIGMSALERDESLGVHFRSDENFGDGKLNARQMYHTTVVRDEAGTKAGRVAAK